MHGKTITTFLVDGSPTGVKTTELSGWIGKAIMVPRAKLKDVKSRPEMQQSGVYFLFGKDDNESDVAYIGETENLFDRIANHDTNKDFWEMAIAFTSKGNDLTKGDVKFLESRAIEKAKQIKRFNLTNNTTPPRNNLPEYQQASMEEFLENIDLLLSASGYPIIKDILSTPDQNLDENSFYSIKTRGVDGKGLYTNDGFIILAGSKGKKEVVESFKGKAKRLRTELLEKGILQEVADDIIFVEDYIGSSPSFAASILTGRPTNGWIEWKMSNGKTLDEMERKNLS
ncbi:MAG: GIY-YIG nuclease family protein [Candidatus Gracilibacteria bacterium]